ncbi:unnamed protein product [Fraxinus pennsylvanica]|uniref:Uncharacterized protein n=1 Tax=Fraxinus pennsylvanica TaxID=56036 RepID=A0AAD1ZYY6_9LAMI|nr:unnamed protein product [Fraxinus pennsylvanica]
MFAWSKGVICKKRTVTPRGKKSDVNPRSTSNDSPSSMIRAICFDEGISSRHSTDRFARIEDSVMQVEAAHPLSEICIEFPDLYIGGYHESRKGPLVVTFDGKAVVGYGGRAKLDLEMTANKVLDLGSGYWFL